MEKRSLQGWGKPQWMSTCWGASMEETIVRPDRAEKLDTGGSRPILPCQDCVRLLERFGDAVGDVLALNETHFLAVVDGDPDPHRFDILIHLANERKQDAKYAYLQHLEIHDQEEVTENEAHPDRT